MTPEYAALAQAVQRWAAQYGLAVDAITLSYRDRPVLVLPLLPPGFGAEPGAPAAERGQTIPPVVRDILTVLREAGKPLTTFGILEAMATRKPPMEWSQRSVSEYLARMVEDGTLENPEGVKPRGYRLPRAGEK